MATAPDKYEAKRKAEAERQRSASESGRDLGPELDLAKKSIDNKRRKKGAASLRHFCELYFPQRFNLAWSADHLKVIGRLETACRSGGLFALAMPRGSGKTTLCEIAAMWAIFTGRRRFVALVGASKDAAVELLDSIKVELEINEKLIEDWPEICLPFVKLEGLANRCKGQLYNGDRTHIGYGQRQLIFPMIPGSGASGSAIRAGGLTGRLRGMKLVTAAGVSIRPDVAIIDDPQTEASAESMKQTKQRIRIISKAILGLAGPGVKISGVMPCTVIKRGDLADQILDRDLYPRWQGERLKMLYSFPADLELWKQYGDIRRASFKNGGDGSEATKFYRANRKPMDLGAVVAWPARREEDELSGIQHAMNLFLDDEDAFFAERQNEPIADQSVDGFALNADEVANRLNHLPRGEVPLACTRLTGFIDVQHKLLYFGVCAWSDDFSGAIVDYGTYPDQGRSDFTLRQAAKTLKTVYPGRTVEEQVAAGLADLFGKLCDRDFPREGGGTVRLDRLLVDAKDGTMAETIAAVVRASPHKSMILPASGIGIGPKDKPMNQYIRRPGERIGGYWIEQRSKRFALRWLLVDSNYWKTQTAQGLAAALTDRGAISLYGSRAGAHRMLADHATAERVDRLINAKDGRERDVWSLKPGRPDNHLWDCLVGCKAAASTLGVSSESIKPAKTKKQRAKASAESKSVNYL